MPLEALQGLVLLVSLGMNIVTALDARATPADVFAAIGRSRTRWMTLSLFGAFLLVIGIGTAGYYLLRVRPELRRELTAQGREHEVSAAVQLTRYLLPALALAVAVVLAQQRYG